MLCKIFENRAVIMHRMHGFNLRQCILSSSLSGCIEQSKSKAIIALPTNRDTVELSEKTLIVRFSCVNTRAAFDSEILLPNILPKNHSKLNIDESFKLRKKTDSKVGCRRNKQRGYL